LHYGKVLGTVVSTNKTSGLESVALKILQPLDGKHSPIGEPLIVADELGARPGDFVLWVASREASLALSESFVPVDAAIVGLIDQGAKE